MKGLKYVWTIIVNIITLIIACEIFSVANDSFESVVLAVLVLIYLSIEVFMELYGLSQLEFLTAFSEELKIIKGLITKQTSRAELIQGANTIDEIMAIPQETDEDKEARQAVEKKKNTAMIKFYINIAFQCVIYFIALYNLVKAI